MIDKNNKIINPHIEDSLLFSTSLIFEQNIDKLWLFLRDLNNEIKIVDYLENLKFLKGDNSWTNGNICSVNWIGLTPLKFICIYTGVDRNKKAIKWKGKGDIGIKYYKTIYLYRITQNHKTLVKSVVSQTEKRNELIDYKTTRNYFLNLEYNILVSKSNYLNNLNENIISYESCIIKKSYLKVWEFISDFQKVCKLSNSELRIYYSAPNLKEGTFIKFYFDDLKMNVFLKIKEIKCFKKKKSWWIKLETISSKIDRLPKFIEYKIIIIDKEKTHLSILHDFPYTLNKDIINSYKIKIKELIKKIKENIEKENEE